MRAVCGLVLMLAGTALAETRVVAMLPGENWWGLANFFGTNMPFTAETSLKIDLRNNNYHNQCASLLVSDHGRVIWSDAQSATTIEKGTITMDAAASVVVTTAGKTLREAFAFASKTYFPPSGRTPDLLFISAPQYNTWIELTYHQNEKDVLAYAQAMLDHGLPPGVLMIDDTWQFAYGTWAFDPRRFTNPRGMMDKLHAQGFKVMLWMCPYVSMDSPEFRRVAWGQNPDDVRGYPTKGGFFLDPQTKRPKACDWWNGVSAFLDFTHPNGRAWFKEQLDRLQRDYGVDGFKFDGADLSAYTTADRLSYKADATSGERNKGFAQFAVDYPVSEFRNAWQMAGQPIVMRLHDKPHQWEALSRIVADMMAASLLGHPFICPDMVGGGEWTTFIPGSPFEPDLFIRSAQVHALCPMMQISASPWRVLDAERQAIFKKTVDLRQKFAPLFVELARHAGRTGEPIIRNLEYNYPGLGYAGVRDQFMMGQTLLVAPQLKKGATSRTVVIPPGEWTADDGTVVTGPRTITVSTPLDRLPHFVAKPFTSR